MRPTRLLPILSLILVIGRDGIAATTDGGQNQSTSGPRSKQRAISLQEMTQPFFKSFGDLGFSLAKSSSAEEEGLPAEFGFAKDIGKTTQYHADFFLKWVPNTTVVHEMLLTPSASVEGHVTSTDKAASDAWRFRVGLQYDTPLPGKGPVHENPVTHHIIEAPSPNWLHIDTNFKYEASRDFNIRKAMAEVELTPDIPSLCIGQTAYHYYIDQQGLRTGQSLTREQVQAGQPPVDFRWRPFLDVDLGTTLDDGTTTTATSMAQPVEQHETVFRIRPRLHADLWLNFVSRALRLHSTRANIEYEYAFLPLEEADASHHHLSGTLSFGFTENVGFNLTYTVGEQSPEFKHERKLAGAMTVAF